MDVEPAAGGLPPQPVGTSSPRGAANGHGGPAVSAVPDGAEVAQLRASPHGRAEHDAPAERYLARSPRPHEGRLPPQDLDAERSVLGAMLLDANAATEAIGALEPDHFYKPPHGQIFAAMQALYERNEPLDEVTLAAQLTSAGQLEQAGGSHYLAMLTERVPTAANVEYYARIVRSRALSRRLIAAATAIAGASYEGVGDIDTLIDDAERQIFQVSSSREQRAFASIKDVVKESFQYIEKQSQTQENVTGVPTGFVDLDNITSGLQRGDLIIIAGRPSMGKTAFAVGIAQNAAINKKCSVAIFSLEMSKEQLGIRMLCSEAHVDSQRVRGGMFQEGDWHRLATAANVLTGAPIFIDDTGSLSVLEMRTKARRLQAEHGLDLVVVDYLQLMRGRGGPEGREREISEISRGLKALAKELHVPVVALSQLNRSLESRQDKRPLLSDLRESGAIEQDADVIAFVHREDYYDKDSENKGLAEVIVGKQRNGPTDTVTLRFFREYTRFENYARERDA